MKKINCFDATVAYGEAGAVLVGVPAGMLGERFASFSNAPFRWTINYAHAQLQAHPAPEKVRDIVDTLRLMAEDTPKVGAFVGALSGGLVGAAAAGITGAVSCNISNLFATEEAPASQPSLPHAARSNTPQR